MSISNAVLQRTDRTPENALERIAAAGYSRVLAKVMFMTIVSDSRSEAVYEWLGSRGRTRQELERRFFDVGEDIEILTRTGKAVWRRGRLVRI